MLLSNISFLQLSIRICFLLQVCLDEAQHGHHSPCLRSELNDQAYHRPAVPMSPIADCVFTMIGRLRRFLRSYAPIMRKKFLRLGFADVQNTFE